MREITVRQYAIVLGNYTDPDLDSELSSMLRDGWELKTFNIVADTYYEGGDRYTRIVDAQVNALQTHYKHYAVCTFERSAAAQALFKSKGAE